MKQTSYFFLIFILLPIASSLSMETTKGSDAPDHKFREICALFASQNPLSETLKPTEASGAIDPEAKDTPSSPIKASPKLPVLLPPKNALNRLQSRGPIPKQPTVLPAGTKPAQKKRAPSETVVPVIKKRRGPIPQSTLPYSCVFSLHNTTMPIVFNPGK